MNAEKIEWVLYVVVVLVLGIGAVLFGFNLMPEMSAAAERGVAIPWFLTWGMIWMTLATSVVIAWHLVKTGGGQVR